VTGAWERFADRADGSETAVYFEHGPARGGPGEAWWYVGPAEVLTLDRRTNVDELRATTDRHLQSRGAGAVGYVGFDAVGLFEPALRQFPPHAPFPLGEFALVPKLEHSPVGALPPRAKVAARPGRPRHDSLPRRQFEPAVRRLIRDIRDGEAFQVVLGHHRSWKRPADLIARAGLLRAAERYAYFYYLQFGDRVVVGASPESVAELDGRRAWVDPIAGTMPAGPRGPRLPLASDPKELAEHRMLVDLARNDLGAIARPGSVRIPWQERRLRYARLDHLVSRVVATLPNGVGPWELLGSTFPAGTVSGAPKIRATELLRREEGSWRGPYGGTVGLLRPGGRASWALAIRSAFSARDALYTAAGAGIVHLSRPGQEYDETLAKLSLVESVLATEAG
jgi:anthranilate/para-aminobenzoate synthase component I